MTNEMNRTLEGTKKGLKRSVISRQWFENDSRTTRQWSRIGSRMTRLWSVIAPMLFVAFGLFGVNESAWGNTASIRGESFKGNRSWSGSHASFTISGDASYNSTLKGLDMGNNTEYTVSWTVNTGCTINVTSVYASIGNSGISKFNAYVGSTSGKINGWSTGSVTASNLSLGNNSSIKIKASSGNAKLYEVKVTYTITPNKPGLSSTTATVNVTLNANNLNQNSPQTVTLGNYFTTEDHFGEFWNYTISNNPGSAGGISEGKFYATKAGTYKVKANIKAKDNCHEKSSDSNELTITVNRLNQTLSWTNESGINTSMKVDDTQTIAASSTSGRAVSYTSSNSDVLTVDANGKLTAVSEGTATITASREQDDQYNAATPITKDFTVSKYNQTLSWNEEQSIETSMLLGATQNISATASSGLEVSYSSNNTDVMTVDATGKLTATGLGTAVITVSQAGNNKYYEATAITKTFEVKTKDTPFFAPNGFNENATKDLKVGDKVTLAVSYVSAGLNGQFTATPSKEGVFAVTREDNTITIEALKAEDATLTFAQAETDAVFAASKTYSFSVTRYDNTLALTTTSETKYVGEEIAGIITDKNSDVAVETSSTDATIAYYDVEHDKIVIPNSEAKSFNSTEVTIKIWQAQNVKFNASGEKTITLTVNKYDNTLDVTTATHTMYVGDELAGIINNGVAIKNRNNADIAVNVASDDTDLLHYSVDADKLIVPNDAEETFVEKVVTLTFSQPETYKYTAAEKTIAVTVKKYVPTFALNKNNLELEQTATLTQTDAEGAEVTIEQESNVISYADGTVTANGVGTATLVVTQPETRTHAYKQQSFEITVTKKTPALSVQLGGQTRTSMTLGYNATATFGYTGKVSDAEVEVAQVDGAAFATYANGKFTTYYGAGTAHFKAVLPETDTYKRGEYPFSIQVNTPTGYLPISGKSYTIGSNSATDWTHKSETLQFNGVPNKLSFKFKYSSGITTVQAPDLWIGSDEVKGRGNVYMLYVEESADNKTWSKVWDHSQPSTDTQESGELPLQRTTRYIRFHHSCNYQNTYSDINITELKYVEEPSATTLDLGIAAINAGDVSKSVSINWCNIAPLHVTCNNPRFSVSPAVFGDYLQYGTQTITISYTHGTEVGEQEGEITITNGVYTKTIQVKASTTKRPQSIIWNNVLSSTGYVMNVGEQYPDETVGYVAAVATGERVTFTSSNSNVIEVVADTAILAKSKGNAQIIAHQAGDAEYAEVFDTVQFTVDNKLKQTITWEQNLQTLLTTSNSVELTATASSEGEISYTSADEHVVKIEGNVLKIVGEGKTTITATQAGGEIGGNEYFPIAQTKTVIVRDPNSQCPTSMIDGETATLRNNTKEFTLSGNPDKLTFTANHGTKSGSFIGYDPVYSELIVEQLAIKNGAQDWYKLFENKVGTNDGDYGPYQLDETATKIRFRTTESGTDHNIKNIIVTRKKFMRADLTAIDQEIESNSLWQQNIKVSHSSIDVMTVSSKQGLVNPTNPLLGEGCDKAGDDILTVSFTPMQKYVHYYDTIVITDGKAQPTTITIPVHLYSKGLNQSISGFDLPEACVATADNIKFGATASSELPIAYHSSDSAIAYVNADSMLVILSSGTVSITAHQAGDNKYDMTEVTKTIVISKAETSVATAPTATEITYGQTLSNAVLNNGVGSVEGTFAWADGTKVLNAGAHAETVIFTPTDAAHYATSSTQVEVTVAKAASSAVAPAAVENLVYTGEAQTLIAAGEAQGGELQYSLDGENWSAELPKAVNAGAYAVYYKVVGDANHNDIAVESIEATIGQKAFTVTAKNESVTYGDAKPDFSVSYEGFAGEETEAVLGGELAFACEYAAGSAVDTYDITPSGLTSNNYAITFVKGTLTVNKKALTVNANDETVTYGDAKPDFSVAYDGFVGEETAAVLDGELAFACDYTAESNVGNYTITPSGLTSGNYAIEFVAGTLTVDKKALVVTADNKTVTYGEAAPEFTVAYDGFVNAETAENLGGELAFACEYAIESNVGEYTITPSGLTSDNYAIEFVGGTLTVNKAASSVTAPTAVENLVYNGEAQTLINEGSANGGELQYSLNNADWSEELPTGTDAGVYTVYYKVVGDANHSDIDAASLNVTIDYTIAYNLAGGNVAEANSTHYNAETATFTLVNPTREHYTFAGWTGSNGDEPQTAVTIAQGSTGNRTYTANWTVNKYTITWLNDDNSLIDETEVEYGVIPTHADATKAATAQYTYTFTGWTPAVVSVTEAATYKATFSSTVNEYTVTWEDEDGTPLETDEDVEYGATPEYNSATPTKAADAEYTYTFKAWDPEIADVTEDAVYTATYTATAKSYTLTWDANGGELSGEYTSGTTAFGTAIVAPTAIRTGYTFAGWTPAVAATMPAANISYAATWTEIKHDVVVEAGENGQVSVAKVENVGIATASIEITATANTGYHFVNWTLPEGVTLADGFALTDATIQINATADEKAIMANFAVTAYTLAWELAGGEVKTAGTAAGSVNYGTALTAPVVEKTGYTFNGWNPAVPETMPAENATYTVQWTINKYTVKFMNGEVELQSSELEYGATPVYAGATPTMDATAQYTYSFAGWDNEIAAVTGDATYTATFNATTNKYTVKFMNGEVELQSSEVEYGATPVYAGATPTKDATAQYTYSFAGWDAELAAVTGDATYNATFNATTNKYTVKFMNGEVELQSTEVEYGTVPAYNGETPTMSATDEFTYTFAGWSPAVVAVTGEATYTATFNATKNKYTVKFMNGETELQSTEVEYGTVPAYNGETPTKSATDEFTYTFAGWSPAVVAVTGEATYTATFNATTNKYTVKFMNGEVELQSTEVEYGTVPAYNGETPTMSATDEFIYTFIGWDPEIAEVTGDATYNAVFSSTKKSYTITWLDDENNQIDQTVVEYGVVPTHADASKAATAQYTYTFEGWTPEVVAVTGEATYKATFSSTVNKYTVTWKDADGTTLETDENVAYGATPSYDGEEPTKAATTQYTYEFAGWTPEVVEVTGDVTYTATYTATAIIPKQTQTIVWEQDLPATLEVGDNTLQLQAEASSWLDIRYTSSDETIAYVDANGYVVALKAGEVTITARQDGNDIYNAAEPVSKTLTITSNEQGQHDATGVEETEAQTKAIKVIRNDQVYIIRNGRTYTATGRLVE